MPASQVGWSLHRREAGGGAVAVDLIEPVGARSTRPATTVAMPVPTADDGCWLARRRARRAGRGGWRHRLRLALSPASLALSPDCGGQAASPRRPVAAAVPGRPPVAGDVRLDRRTGGSIDRAARGDHARPPEQQHERKRAQPHR